jgi:tRNA pseudouridine55 synthase
MNKQNKQENKQEPSGLVLVNKPAGISSHDLVAKIRYQLQMKSVGHCGTLDPMATGLMVILLGEATKISQYILEGNKGYKVGFRLGIKTDTQDITGKVIESKDVDPEKHSQEMVVSQGLALSGDLNLAVPSYSAVKIDGRKLYDYARTGQEVPVVDRVMSFYDIEYLSKNPFGDYCFSLKCTKGSYIRAWVNELGDRLGCGATMTSLVRTFSDPFHLSDAVEVDQVANALEKDSRAFKTLTEALNYLPTVRVMNYSETLMKNGQIAHDLRRQLIAIFNPEVDSIVRVMGTSRDEVLALIGLEKDKGFVVRRVFRY